METIFREVRGIHMPHQITESQETYTQFLEEIPVSPERRATPEAKATPGELRDFRGGLGGVLWITATRVELAHWCSVLAGRVHQLVIGDLLELNKLIRRAKAYNDIAITHRRLEGSLSVLSMGDSNLDPAGERIYQGTAIFLVGEIPGQNPADADAFEDAMVEANYILSTSRKSTKAQTNSLSAEVHGAVAAFDHGRYVQILLDFFHGHEIRPVLQWPDLRRKELPSPSRLLQFCDCESLIKHLLKEGGHMSQDRRFVGYMRVLEEALASGEIHRLFHIATRHNVSDVLTKIMISVSLEFWRKTGKLKLEPGEYGARAEARRMERRARAAAAKREVDRKSAFPSEL
jgi:hypothetical protein